MNELFQNKGAFILKLCISQTLLPYNYPKEVVNILLRDKMKNVKLTKVENDIAHFLMEHQDELGSLATRDIDNHISAVTYDGKAICYENIKVVHNNVDNTKAGSYEVKYEVEDRGNKSQKTITVKVVNRYDYLCDDEWTST